MHKRVEEVALNAWPALQQMLYDGWLLRFANGYTKRANSVNPLCASSLDVHTKITVCEQVYAEKELPPVFRLTPFALPSHLDRVLEQRHYRDIDHSLILCRDLQQMDIPAPSRALCAASLDDWMESFSKLSRSDAARQQTHKQMLEAIPARRLLVSLVEDGVVVACGMGVLEDRYFGLFDIVTDPQRRNRGYGTQLVSGMLAWARANGAAVAYLQVTTHNLAARHLYAKLGFEELYRYWYRIAAHSVPAPGAPTR